MKTKTAPATKKPEKKKPITLADLKKVFTDEDLKRFADGARFITSTEPA